MKKKLKVFWHIFCFDFNLSVASNKKAKRISEFNRVLNEQMNDYKPVMLRQKGTQDYLKGVSVSVNYEPNKKLIKSKNLKNGGK